MFSIKKIIDNLNVVLVFDFTSFSHHFNRSCVLSFCTSFDSQSDQWEEGREHEREGEKICKRLMTPDIVNNRKPRSEEGRRDGAREVG
jgi:hypothetical protein